MTQEQVNRYLERIRYFGEIAMNEECLQKLIWSHLTSVPFENLEIFDEGRVPQLAPERLYEKIVECGRGGCCFELNRLFFELLKAVGFEAKAVAARVVWMKKELPPFNHRGTVVSLGDQLYFCDVGYGGPGPKGLLRLCESMQEIGKDRFAVSRTEKGWYQISRFHEGAFVPILLVDMREVEEADFGLMNFYCSKSELVLFTQKRIVNLCTEQGSLALTDEVLTVRDTNGIRRESLSNRKELEECLARQFGLKDCLPPL